MTRHARSADRSVRDTDSTGEPASGLGDRQLVVVSNRQPYRHDTADDGSPCVQRPTGGLTAGLDPVVQRTGGTWVAWGDGERDFEVVDEDGVVPVPPDDPGYRLKRLRLSEAEVDDYYYGFSNQVLWPLCHAALTRVRCDPGFWRRYKEVNERFAAAAAEAATGQPVVWFQDYHLALAPGMVRPHLDDAAVVAQFWHVPWPGWDTFRAAPHARDLLSGLLGNDFLGFHTPRYRTNFLRCVDAALGGATVDRQAGTVEYRGRTTTVGAIPLGVPVEEIERGADRATTGGTSTALEREHGLGDVPHLAIGVDRLDYTKGIVERLRALEHLWETYPEWRAALTYVENGSESRSRISAYRRVQERVAEAVDAINERFGTDTWQPVVSITERLSREALFGLYRRADVALVTPIRDGLNLVAQEYVAARGDGDGVLVLSDQAGVHDELGEAAVTVSPSDTEATAEGIRRALTMPATERRLRMRRLRRWVTAHDLDHWLDANVEAAVASTEEAIPATGLSTT